MRIALLALALSALCACSSLPEAANFSGATAGVTTSGDTYGTSRRPDVYGAFTRPSTPTMLNRY